MMPKGIYKLIFRLEELEVDDIVKSFGIDAIVESGNNPPGK